uniref:Uncharacterized protein n=1 Tax=Globodera rostochiensis TaxID=31243 RepID=A0A914H8K4_GLORO
MPWIRSSRKVPPLEAALDKTLYGQGPTGKRCGCGQFVQLLLTDILSNCYGHLSKIAAYGQFVLFAYGHFVQLLRTFVQIAAYGQFVQLLLTDILSNCYGHLSKIAAYGQFVLFAYGHFVQLLRTFVQIAAYGQFVQLLLTDILSNCYGHLSKIAAYGHSGYCHHFPGTTMADDGPEASFAEAMAKWLHTPRGDGRPKVLYSGLSYGDKRTDGNFEFVSFC